MLSPRSLLLPVLASAALATPPALPALQGVVFHARAGVFHAGASQGAAVAQGLSLGLCQ